MGEMIGEVVREKEVVGGREGGREVKKSSVVVEQAAA